MPTIGVASILVTPTFKNLQQTVGRELDGVSQNAGRSSGSKMGAALGGALKVGALAAGGAVIGGLGLALTKGFGRLQAIENAKAKLTGLGHTADAVAGIMKNATAAVSGTAFGLDEAATVAAGAVAAGIKPGKELERTLKLTGDAATIAGVGMGEMGAIFNKVASSNKIQGDVIAQLNDAGIPIVQLLGKELGTTAEETVNLASKGKIGFDTFQKAMEKGLGGAALEGGKTLQGAFKNTMAAVGRIGANLLSGVYPKIQAFFSNAIGWLKPLEEGAKVAGAAIGDYLEKGLLGAQGIMDTLATGEFSTKLREAFNIEEDSKFVDFLFNARTAVINLGSFVQTDLIPALQDFGKWITGTAIPALQQFGQWLNENKRTIGIVAGVVTTLMIPALIRWGVEATIAGIKNVIAWATSGAGAVKTAVMYVVNSYKIIGTWIAMGLAAIKSGAETAAIWLMYRMDAAKAVASMLVAKTRIVASWVVMGVQSLLAGAKMAAAWFLALGPIGWVIAAVVGLVALVIANWDTVVSWTKTAWEAVAGAVQVAIQWIQDAAGNVAAFFQTYFLAPIQSVLAAVGAVFTWIYTAIIKPVFDSIMVIANGFYLGFRGIFQLVVAIFTEIIAPAFMNFWHGIVEPVFNGIIGAVTSWWAGVQTIFNNVISFIQTVFSAVFTWFRDSVITPVFNFIAAAVGFWWATVSGIFNAVIGFVRTVFSAAFTWLRDVVIVPVFNFILGVITTWWTNVQANFNAVVNFIRTVLGAAFTWFRDSVITPVWNGIRDTISNVWNNGIKPIFDFISSAIKDTVPKAFQKGVDAIKGIWNTILDIAKAPVKFVINTVINDGLIGAFNKIAKILPGIDELPRVALPKGFRSGGYTGNLPSGAIAGVVHGDEQVIKSPSRRSIERRAPGFLDALNTMGARALDVMGFKGGGRVWPTASKELTQGYHAGHDGIDIGVPTGTPVFATGPGVVSFAGSSPNLGNVWGGNEIRVMGDGLERWFSHLSNIGVKVGQTVHAGQQIGLSGNSGITSGPHLHFGVYNGGYPNSMNPLSYLSGASAPKGGGGGLFDPLGFIRGLADKVVGQVKGAFPMGGFMIDAVTGVGKKLFGSVIDWVKGKFGMGATAGPQHGAHLDPLLYDQGGILRPGLSHVVNQTQQPEYILNPRQWADIHHLATAGGGGGRGDVIFQGNVGWSPDEVANRIETKRRDTFAAFGI